MAEGGGSEDVQSYLEQHRISSLFETLMSKIVKECPADPIEFLIGKLQVIQRQRKKGVSPAHTNTTNFGSRSKIQVTGKSVTPKSSATNKVSRSAEQTSKTSETRPSRPKMTGMTSFSTSALKKPTSTTKTTPTKMTSSPSRPITSSSGLKTPSSIPKTTSPASRRPITAPGGSRVANTSGSRSSAALKRGSKLPVSSLPGKSPASSTSSLSKSPRADKTKAAVSKKSSPTKAPKVKEEKKQEAKRGDDVRNTRETNTEEIDEFFGDARKSSSRRLQTQSDSEFEGDDSKEVSKDRRLIDSDEDDELELTLEDSTTTSEFNLEEIVKKRLRSRCGKKSHGRLQSLLCPSPPDTSASSLGYHSDEEETDSGESDGVEVSEDHALLEDEGVTGLSRGKYAVHKIQSTPDSAKVDLKVVICSRCALVIADGEPKTEVSSSRLTNQTFTQSRDGDFESASQVHVGSQPSFPQWEAGSAVSGSEVGGGSSGRSHDQSSDVTLQSCDTWGGLAPPIRVPDIPSETDSEVQLPPPPPLEGKSWLPDPPTQHDPHGWGTTQ